MASWGVGSARSRPASPPEISQAGRKRGHPPPSERGTFVGSMRLALLGPAGEDERALERVVLHLVNQVGVDRGVYLGVDGALDRVVRRLAAQRVSSDPSAVAIWERATRHCLQGSPEEIRSFVAAERWLHALSVFASLPSATTRSIELIAGKVAVFVYDKSTLDEEDILPASILAFGRSEHPVMRQIGNRWFLAPGPFDRAGCMVLEDSRDGIYLTLLDSSGREHGHERLSLASGAKLKVTGPENSDSPVPTRSGD